MEVSFVHVEQADTGEPVPKLSQDQIEKMLRSIRETMPAARIVQMTDEDTPEVDGVDEVVRRPFDGFLMPFRLEHLADYPHEEMVILDTDVLVKKSVEHVFADPFDVCLTYRDRPIRSPEGIDITKFCPYNTGVMFSKGRDFWRACFDFLKKMTEVEWRWWGDQLAVAAVADSKAFDVKTLPCSKYNWVPFREDAQSEAYIWHFKGKRKIWM